MFENSTDAERTGLLSGTLKVAALLVAVSLLAAGWLSAGLDRAGPRLAGTGRPSYDDPVTTGSIAQAGNQTRLDPCTTPRRP